MRELPTNRRAEVSPKKRGRPRGGFTQHRRLDALRSLLERHPKGLTLEELAAQLQVTTRSLRRYLREVSRELDLVSSPVKPGGARYWKLAPGEATRKVDLRRTQAYALLAARRLFEPLRGSTLFEEIDLASRRLIGIAKRPGRGPNAGVIEARLEDRFLYAPFAPKDYGQQSEIVDDVFQAVSDLRPLRCSLLNQAEGAFEYALLHPYAMVLYKDALFCIARHVERARVIAFPIDHLRDTECEVATRFDLPDDFDASAYVQGQFGIWSGGKPKRVVIDLDATVAELVRSRRVHPSQVLSPLPNGALRLTLAIADLTEVAIWVLGFGDTARVVEPPELVERVRSTLDRARLQYEKPAARRR